ncbi:UDP-glucose flavonoid 3-O-glucosyltransferase 7 [Linum perenne]
MNGVRAMIDIVKLFAIYGIKFIVVKTFLNTDLISNQFKPSGHEIDLQIIRFPAAKAGLLDESDSIACPPFRQRLGPTQTHGGKILDKIRPDCLAADTFFSWAIDAATKFGIPRSSVYVHRELATGLDEARERVHQASRRDGQDFSILKSQFSQLLDFFVEVSNLQYNMVILDG